MKLTAVAGWDGGQRLALQVLYSCWPALCVTLGVMEQEQDVRGNGAS